MIQTGVLLSKPNDDKSMGSQQMQGLPCPQAWACCRPWAWCPGVRPACAWSRPASPRHLPGGAAEDGPAAGGHDDPAGGAGQAPGWPSLHGGAGATGAAEKGRRSAGAREAAADGQDLRRPPRTRDGCQTAHDVRHASRQPHERHGSPRAPPPWGEHDAQPETEGPPSPRGGWQKGVPDFLEFGNCV